MVSCNCLCKQCCACVFYEYSSCWLCRRQGVSVFHTCKKCLVRTNDEFWFSLYDLYFFLLFYNCFTAFMLYKWEYRCKEKRKNTFIFTLLIFVMYICTEVFPKAKELVQNNIIFAVMCAIYAVVLPIYALFRLKGGKQGD